MSLVLVDLPNFFNSLVQSFSLPPKKIKDYFLHWLEMDLLAAAINPEEHTIGSWIFYSNRAMGRTEARISPEELKQFAIRTNLSVGVSALEAGVPGQQGESFEFECSKCGEKNITQTRSEKGIDSTIITHLFDTMDNWKVATIISHDADYCPAIRALRKRGKIIFGAGFPTKASEALIAECFGFIDMKKRYLEIDLALFSFFEHKAKLSELIKKSNETKGIEVSCWIAKSAGERPGGIWKLSLKGDSENRNNPELKEMFRSDVAELKREYPFILIGGDRGFNYFEELEIKLNDFQLECLRRKSKKYIEFKIDEIELIDMSRFYRRW